MKYRHTEEELRTAIKESLSIADICRKLGIVSKGGNYRTLKARIKKHNIDISHFTGQGWNQGKRYRNFKPKLKLELILIENSSYSSSNSLKTRLFNEGILNNKCDICNLMNWMGKPIKCELDHINGNNTDHRLENLRILCPNCHSQTNNFRGRNMKRPVM